MVLISACIYLQKDVYISKVVVPCNFCTLHFLIWVPLNVRSLHPPTTLSPSLYLTMSLWLAPSFAPKITWMTTHPPPLRLGESPLTSSHTGRGCVPSCESHEFQKRNPTNPGGSDGEAVFSGVYWLKVSASFFDHTVQCGLNGWLLCSHVIYFMLLWRTRATTTHSGSVCRSHDFFCSSTHGTSKVYVCVLWLFQQQIIQNLKNILWHRLGLFFRVLKCISWI